MLILTVIGILAGAGIVGGTYFSLMKKVSRSVGAERGNYDSEIAAASKEIEELLAKESNYVSKKQVESVSGMLESTKSQLQAEKDKLKITEKKLDEAQKGVDEREAKQQSVKSSNEQDEEQMGKLRVDYEQLTEESMVLEKQLAESMKYLDTIAGEIELTEEQQSFIKELSESLNSAGGNLRNLIGEYDSVHNRLEGLRAQHGALEEEYTKLVEQQLGG